LPSYSTLILSSSSFLFLSFSSSSFAFYSSSFSNLSISAILFINACCIISSYLAFSRLKAVSSCSLTFSSSFFILDI
jgi:hypothetical protein